MNRGTAIGLKIQTLVFKINNSFNCNAAIDTAASEDT